MTLDDAARFIDHHSLINRTVYDLDVLVDANDMGGLPHQNSPPPSESSESYSEEKSGIQSEAVERASFRADEVTTSVGCVCQLCDSLPTLVFESRFESGNLRKAIQVIFSVNQVFTYC